MSSVRSRPSRRQQARTSRDLTEEIRCEDPVSSHGNGADDFPQTGSSSHSEVHSSRDQSVSRVAGRREKSANIQKCLESDPVDINSLRQLAISRGGLINDELRRKAWPELLGVDVSNIQPKPDQSVLKAHRDYNQVVLDVNRSLKRFPPGMEEQKRLGLQDQLVDVIMRILVNREELHYYQRLGPFQFSPKECALWYCLRQYDQPAFDIKVVDEEIGKGVFARSDFSRGHFLFEYQGELLEYEEGLKREREYPARLGSFIYFFSYQGKYHCIDATRHECVGKYANDATGRCKNAFAKILEVDGKPHICLFASRQVKKGQEIRFDYGVPNLPWRKKANQKPLFDARKTLPAPKEHVVLGDGRIAIQDTYDAMEAPPDKMDIHVQDTPDTFIEDARKTLPAPKEHVVLGDGGIAIQDTYDAMEAPPDKMDIHVQDTQDTFIEDARKTLPAPKEPVVLGDGGIAIQDTYDATEAPPDKMDIHVQDTQDTFIEDARKTLPAPKEPVVLGDGGIAIQDTYDATEAPPDKMDIHVQDTQDTLTEDARKTLPAPKEPVVLGDGGIAIQDTYDATEAPPDKMDIHVQDTQDTLTEDNEEETDSEHSEVLEGSTSEYEPDGDIVSDSSDSSHHSEVYPLLSPKSVPPSFPRQVVSVPLDKSTKTSIQVMQTNNADGRKYDKKVYCPYCDISQSKFPRHLITIHKTEPEVIKYDIEKDRVIKRNMLTRLRNLGNHRHNTNVLQQKKGQLIVVYRPDNNVEPENYVPCEHCLGYYVSWDLWKHVKRCPLGPQVKSEHTRVLQRCRLLLPTPSGSSEELKELLDTMKSDDVGRIVKSDPLILQLGAKLFLRNGHDKEQFSYIRNTLREVGRLLIDLRKSASLPDSGLGEYIHPTMYQMVVKSARSVAGFDTVTHQYATPSLALKLGHSIKKCAKIVESNALQKGDQDSAMTALNFHKLCEMSWTEEVSTHALRTLNELQRNRVKFIPLIKDVTILTEYIKKSGRKAYENLSLKQDDIEAWKELNQAGLTQVTLFNRRRQGEVSKAKVDDYNRQHNTAQEDLNCVLSPLEEKLCQSLQRIEIVGKRGRTVPLLLTQEMKKWIDLLLITREKVGVHSHNQFLFPRLHYGSLGHIRGCDVLRDYSEICGAKFPKLLRSTKLRKQIATLSQLLNLKENELDLLANFMGHDIRVHREYYRLPEETLQVAKISKVLLSLESGRLPSQKGKSLDEITLDEGEELDVTMGECLEEEEDNDEEETEREQNDFACSTTDKPIGQDSKRQKGVKRPWSEAEKAVLVKHFNKHISLQRAPRKGEIERCKAQEHILNKRTWLNIKDYVRYMGGVAKSKKLF